MKKFAIQLGRRLVYSLLILLGINLLTLSGLYLFNQGRRGLPVEPLTLIVDLVKQLYTYLFDHPTTYFWDHVEVPAFSLVGNLFLRSVGLLLVSLLIALIVGGLLGVMAASTRRTNLRPVIILLSITGISMPSFLLAMLLWIADFRLYRVMELPKAPLPPTGFGWDLHLIMPALVLAARPLAQIMQVTYIYLSDAVKEDYVRVAQAKGAWRSYILARHLLPNLLIPLLTTMGASLRFSLASLPIVESFFLWGGVGQSILEAIDLQMLFLVVDLVMALGIFFLALNLGLDFLYPLIDPRLRPENGSTAWNEAAGLQETWGSLREGVVEWLRGIVRRWARPGKGQTFLAAGLPQSPVERASEARAETGSHRPERVSGLDKLDQRKKEPDQRKKEVDQQKKEPDQWQKELDSAPAFAPRQRDWSALANLPLILGGLLALALLFLVLWGGRLTEANPYQTHTIMTIAGKIQAPPFKPSDVFPWGTDLVGRDIQALVLNGARQTLSLALLATLARVALGVILGVIAGWWSHSWFDRLVNAINSVWAAFPETIFAMLLILALGIQRGQSVFIIALCVVGWGQVSQFIRSEVITQKPRLFVEAARSLGAPQGHILLRHMVPFLIPPVIILLALEMGGVLMLLAELGFLNIFLGGGFKAMIAEGAGMVPVIYYFSDIPEWGALLANIRNWWRSYDWLAWYPGLFFFVSILTFNLFGEGLRRLFRESRLNLHRLFNRYTLVTVPVVVIATMAILRTQTPLHLYVEPARTFNLEQAQAHIAELAKPEYAGRMTGTPEEVAAAEYIANQMKAIGLHTPPGRDTFLLTNRISNRLYTGMPILSIAATPDGEPEVFTYRQDFVEYIGSPGFGSGAGQVVGLVRGAHSTKFYEQNRHKDLDRSLRDKVVIVRDEDMRLLYLDQLAGLLVVSDDETVFSRRYLPSNRGFLPFTFPALNITPEVAERLLATCGSSLAGVDRLAGETEPDMLAVTEPGVTVNLEAAGGFGADRDHYTVVGMIPGQGASQGLDRKAIVVSAYFDGLGQGPEGSIYPGANDNASGVAAMLEIARVLRSSPYPPDKTIIFVAWSDGERGEGFSLTNAMNPIGSFSSLEFESVIELTGVGGGSGDALALGQGTSYRLAGLIQKAARQIGVPVTTRGRDPHFGRTTRQGFGERTALSAYFSWDGSDQYAHTPEDVPERIEPEKLRLAGETVLLTLLFLSRETNY